MPEKLLIPNKQFTTEAEAQVRKWCSDIANPVEYREPLMMMLDALNRERTKVEELSDKKPRGKGITVGDVIRVLNEALRLDPSAISALFMHQRVACNQALSDHPTIQVCAEPHSTEKPCPCGHPMSVGVLGLLNGFFGIDDQGYGMITAEVDNESGFVTQFRRTTTANPK